MHKTLLLNKEILIQAYKHICQAKAMAAVYEANRSICKYVHSTSRGHEAIQLATAYNLLPCDYVSPYYRDESIMLGLGFSPYTLMLQLLAKGEDIFTGGRSYYNHPNYRGADKPTIIHQSSATGMQAIPTTGVAQGVKYLKQLAVGNGQEAVGKLQEARGSGQFAVGKLQGANSNGQHPVTNESTISTEQISPDSYRGQLPTEENQLPIVVCSLGDASITEGEVSEAFQFAALHQLPIIFLVQDNDWGISVTSAEARTSNAYEFIQGFKGIKRESINGADFVESYAKMQTVINDVRENCVPYLVHAKVPLLGHHTSGVRKDFYRTEEELQKSSKQDPYFILKECLQRNGVDEAQLLEIENDATTFIQAEFNKAVAAAEPTQNAEALLQDIFVPTTITAEKGERTPIDKEKILMVDAALFAIREIMEDYPEAVLYGQDVGRRLGGVFREAATLAEQFGDHRVFNTAIQEAYIIGSTIGMSAVGAKPIVEVQFADYIYPGLNQLVTEISKSCFLSCGKFPVQTLIRVPIGAYGGGGPYHSGSIESTLLTIKGIKIVYPSCAADMKGLMKAAFLDPNPVIMLEHKGLYWSKVPGTEDAKNIEPSRDYIIPLGKGNIVLHANADKINNGETCCVITYGMGVYWAKAAAKTFAGQVEVIDLRTLFPLDEELIFATVKKHGKCLILTEEQQNNSFAEALAGRVSKACFKNLDAAIEVMGALNLPAVPMNVGLEKIMLPSAEKVVVRLRELLGS
jgi:2-oxoisovalerate dehydrogenase E1 component